MSGQLKNVIAAKLKSMDETGAVNYDVVGIVDEYKTEFINMCQGNFRTEVTYLYYHNLLSYKLFCCPVYRIEGI
jgi:hypothetical protein